MGESVAEGTVTAWRKRVGDTVENGEALVDVTTDKVDVEVPAPAAGKVVKILADEGATVKVGGPLAEIETSGDGVKSTSASTKRAEPVEQNRPQQSTAAPVEQVRPLRTSVDASPLALRAAALRNVELNGIKGSGPGGIVRRSDVLGDGAVRTVEQARPLPPAAPVDQAPPLQPPASPVEQARPLQPSAPLPPGATPLKGPAGCARQLHGREPVDPDRDELPHDRRRHARGAAPRPQ